jgi:hypothetical protein
MLAPLQNPALASQRFDSQSQIRQQPPYHRSADPAFAVLIAICTSCRCVPQFFVEADALRTVDGSIYPCCASRFDAARTRLLRARASTFPYRRTGPPRVRSYQPDRRRPFDRRSKACSRVPEPPPPNLRNVMCARPLFHNSQWRIACFRVHRS